MPTPRESRAELALLTDEAVGMAGELLSLSSGTAEQRRTLLLDGAPGLIDYYAEGSAALALDFYEEQRELADVQKLYRPALVIVDRAQKIRDAIVWAAEPLFDQNDELAGARLAEVTQLETARPYRDTITTNRKNDPASVGWRRITNGGCKFCRMLADRGAVYKQATARFAAHGSCKCTAAPVFEGGETGPEASAIQYVASQRRRSSEQQAALRAYLDSFY